jgi:GH35 family endo-1,4-beta-xylanase
MKPHLEEIRCMRENTVPRGADPCEPEQKALELALQEWLRPGFRTDSDVDVLGERDVFPRRLRSGIAAIAFALPVLFGGCTASGPGGVIAETPTPITTPTNQSTPSVVPTTTSTEAPTKTVIPLTATPKPAETPTPVLPLEKQPATIAAVTEFANAMKAAGIATTPEYILQQGLTTREITGTDGKKYSVASTKDGYPLMIKRDGGVWRPDTLTQELDANGLGLGLVYNAHNNPFATAITRSPRNDDIIRENARLLGTAEGFYWSKLFWVRGSGTDPSKQDWRWVDEYMSFLNANNIQDASPQIIDRLDNYYHAWLVDLSNNSPKSEATRQVFIDILQTNITQIVRHSKATVHSWTINEILDNNGGMSDNVWMRTIGQEYVNVAIQAVRKEDPGAKLVLNDYYLENNPIKNKKMIDLTEQLLGDKILRQGDIVGIEGHQSILGKNITSEQIRNALRPFIDMGLTARITELDTFDVFSNDVDAQQKKADLYMKYFVAAIGLNREYGRSVVDAVVLWTTTHSQSWHHFDDKYKNKAIYPGLFSDQGERELAYYLISRATLELIH